MVTNLDNYPKLFPASQRAAAARAVSTPEKLSDYGPQAVPAAPSSSDAYDLTSLLVRTLKNYKPGTCGPAA